LSKFVVQQITMAIKVLTFGRLADITGSTITLDGISNTDELIGQLNKLYPELTHHKYLVAVDKKIISARTELTGDNTVALLPPFSGG